jgi:hypothetical protein
MTMTRTGPCAVSPTNQHELDRRQFTFGTQVMVSESCKHCKWGKAYELEPKDEDLLIADSVPGKALLR